MLDENIEVKQHSAPLLVLAITDEDGDAHDFTGWTGFEFRRKTSFIAADPAPLYTDTGATPAITILAPATGQVRIRTAAADNADPGFWFYRLSANDPEGFPQVLAEGSYVVVQN